MNGNRVLVLAAILWLGTASAPMAGQTDKATPMPRVAVPRLPAPPVIDGTMDDGEWDRAAAVTGFAGIYGDPEVVHTQTVVWIGYDDTHLYVCLKNMRGPTLDILSKRARAQDEKALVFDQANEVWITPPTSPPESYQTMFNAYPAVFDLKIIPSLGYTAQSWSGEWDLASSASQDAWTIEARAEIERFGVDAIPPGAVWRGLFTRDLGDPEKFRAWAPGGGFAKLDRHGYLHFLPDSASFQWLDMESLFAWTFDFPMAVTASAGRGSTVRVTLRCGREMEPGPDDLVIEKTVKVAAGQRRTFTLSGNLADKLPVVTRTVKKNPLTQRRGPTVEKEVIPGWCELTAVDQDDTVLYYQIFPFVADRVVRTSPETLRETPYETAFGIDPSYAPLNKKLIVKVDRLYMERRAEVAGGTVQVVDAETDEVVAGEDLFAFRHDYAIALLDLEHLELPVETEEAWEAAEEVRRLNKLIAAENPKRQAAGEEPLALKDVPEVEGRPYRVEVRLTDEDGELVAADRREVALKGYEFRWLGNDIGIADHVIEPWTPLEWDFETLTLWNKEYRFDGLGLAERIVNDGRPQLSGPMRLLATVDGEEIALDGGRPQTENLVEAYGEFSGQAQDRGLRVAGDFRVEFDGAVINHLTYGPADPEEPIQLDALSLEVRMPREEAELMVTTSGGWFSYHGFTPERWDSRQTAGGGRLGNFVPYIFLTDSERGFTWFADNDKGWSIDPEAPALELFPDGEAYVLRVNFVTKPLTLTADRTVEWGWSVTPQKPQPEDFRAWVVGIPHRPHPKSPCTFYATKQVDWAVLWPYYCSPFPWDYEKSKAGMKRYEERDVYGLVGHIAHSIGRYQDYRGRTFHDVAADWGEAIGDRGNGNVARSKGPTDFQLWHFDRWIGHSNMRGLYHDENYRARDTNFITGGAYLLPDGTIQPGYNYMDMREYYKRLRYLFAYHNVPRPYLWAHTTSQHPVYAWLPDVAMEGENVAPSNRERDYIESLPAGRLRAIAMGRNLGTVPSVMAQVNNKKGHYPEELAAFLVRQFVGWVLLHDCIPNSTRFWNFYLQPEMELWHGDIRFLPYWEETAAVQSRTEDVLCSAHTRPGATVLWLMNTAREARRASVAVDLEALDLTGRDLHIFDAETGAALELRRGVLTVDVPARTWRAIRLKETPGLAGGQTFVCRFDDGDAVAEASLGDAWPDRALPRAYARGRSGKALPLPGRIQYRLRHHVRPAAGSISFAINLERGRNPGRILSLGNLELWLNNDQVRLREGEPFTDDRGRRRQRWTFVVEAPLPEAEADGWHSVELRWEERAFVLVVAGRTFKHTLARPMPTPPMGRGLAIDRLVDLTFEGPNHGTVLLDDLVMRRGD